MYVIKDTNTGKFWAGGMRRWIVDPKMAVKIERSDATVKRLIQDGFTVELMEYVTPKS